MPRIKKGAALEFLVQHIDTESNECILWPYSKIGLGYGSLAFEGRTQAANRVMLILKYGEPSQKMVAAHSCKNKACVNPNHLRWATQSENLMDKVKDGTSNRGSACGNSKLTEDQVAEIVRLHQQGLSRRMLAERFGVTVWTIHAIFQGKSWAWKTQEVAA